MAIVDVLESGTLGFFWTLSAEALDLESDPERGHVSTEGGWAVVDVLDEDPFAKDRDESGDAPQALVGVMPEEAALFLEVQGPSLTRRFGGDPRASSKRYLARTVIGSAPVHRMRTPSLLELHAHFHGIGRWAGMTAVRENPQTEEGRLRSWSVTLAGSDDLSQKLPRGRTLLVSTTWRVDGPPDRRAISAPVSIGCESDEPVGVWELLQPILEVQDLLGFAFGGFVTAEGGSAGLDVARDKRYDTKPSFWNGVLMVRHPAAQAPESMSEFTLFDLETIGGVAGLARWIRLAVSHPRATNPVVLPFRHGPSSPAVTVMELAAGMEYWVKANRPAAWALGEKYPQAIAKRCGRPFSDWVGNPDGWAKAFWDANNHLKHEPTYVADPIELTDLATSARYLLGAALLDRVAGTKAPSRAIFKHHRLRTLGTRLRDRYA